MYPLFATILPGGPLPILAILVVLAIIALSQMVIEQGGSTLTRNRIVEAKTAAYTVVAGQDEGKTFTNAGAAGAITFSLPAATVGQSYRFLVQAAQELRIDPNGTETIALPETGVQGAAGKYLTANAIGEFVHLECIIAGTWTVIAGTLANGLWTAEA